jgi:hypothetical protein
MWKTPTTLLLKKTWRGTATKWLEFVAPVQQVFLVLIGRHPWNVSQQAGNVFCHASTIYENFLRQSKSSMKTAHIGHGGLFWNLTINGRVCALKRCKNCSNIAFYLEIPPLNLYLLIQFTTLCILRPYLNTDQNVWRKVDFKESFRVTSSKLKSVTPTPLFVC